MASSTPSIKRNVFANYTSQFYTVAVGIIMAPVYLAYMGTEAYGLIGFFTMMTSWFQLLDIGLTPTLTREAARFRGGAIGVTSLRALLRALEVVFGSVSLLAGAAMLFLAHDIATNWLHAKTLSVDEVGQAVMLMGLAVPLRWTSGLYRGAIMGFEEQVWLGGYTIAISTLRFVCVLAVFTVFGPTPTAFFGYQLFVAAVELGGLAVMAYRLVRRGDGPHEPFSWAPLFTNLTFSLTIAFTATVWIVVTQTDKLILSKILSLANYGVFSLAVVAAGGIYTASIPFGQAVLPRLTKLAAEKNESGLVNLYGNATQAVCVLVAPAVALLTFFAEPTMRGWTGNLEIAHHAAPILQLYTIGNGCLAIAAFAYYMQYAKGDLLLHFIGNLILLVLLVPLFYLSALHFGAVGTGLVWATANALYAFCWVPVIHARVYKGHHWDWLKRNVLTIAIPTLLLGQVLAWLLPIPAGRWESIAFVMGIGVLLLAAAAAASSSVRLEFARRIGHHFRNARRDLQ